MALGPTFQCEFVGTFALVMAVCLNVAGATPLAVTSIALTLMVCIYAMGDVSGANFNPAVSLSLGLTGKMPWGTVGAYTLVQIFGGFAAGIVYYSGLRGPLDDAVKLSPVQIDNGKLPVFLGEVLYTCMLCFVVLNVAATKRNQPNNYFGLAIGLVIVAGGTVIGPYSGGVLNPAVAVGILAQHFDVKSQAAAFGTVLAGEVVGAVLATGLYRLVHPEEFVAEGEEQEPGIVQCVSSEVIGTFYLVLTIALSSGDLAAWAIAASLACMVYSLGSVSGAHFNPAVTLALKFRGAAGAYAWAYPAAQILGATAGASVADFLIKFQANAPAEVSNNTLVAAGCAELIYTTLLAFVVLCIATVDGKDLRDVVGFTVGSCITAGGYAIGRISGASLNPAVTLALAITGSLGMRMTAVHLVSQFAASITAVALFSATHIQKALEEEPFARKSLEEGYAAAKLSDIPAASASGASAAEAGFGAGHK